MLRTRLSTSSRRGHLAIPTSGGKTLWTFARTGIVSITQRMGHLPDDEQSLQPWYLNLQRAEEAFSTRVRTYDAALKLLNLHLEQ